MLLHIPESEYSVKRKFMINIYIIFGNLKDFKKLKIPAGLQGIEWINIKAFPLQHK
jgi:hypothetical protein